MDPSSHPAVPDPTPASARAPIVPGAPGVPGVPGEACLPDGVERELDPRVILLDRRILRITALAVLLGGLVGVVCAYFFAPPWVAAAAAAGTVVMGALAWRFAQRWPALEHRHQRYAIDGDEMRIRSGVYWRSHVHVARSRIQHTDVTQGPFERRLGLATLVVFTAGRDHSKVELRGLDHALAQAIRAHLAPRAEHDGL